jgi:choice-of-anchor C domain-containing protein
LVEPEVPFRDDQKAKEETKSMKKLKLAIMASALMPFVASANLVTDGTFTAAGTPGSYTEYAANTTMGGWTVTGGSVDLIGGYWQAPQLGQNSVDMSGVTQGTIQQTINLSPGTYKLTFAESGNPDGPPELKRLAVSLGGGTPQEFDYTIGNNTRDAMSYILKTAYFTVGGGDNVLQFQDVSASAPDWEPSTPWGAVVGNVSLTAVPEPTTIISGVLMLLPFGASTLRILRKKQVA